MSQLGSAPSASEGEPGAFPKLSWADFVQLVLELTITAYQAMFEARIARVDWPEDTFTSRLKDYIQQIGFDYNVRVNFRHRIHTAPMDEGQQPPKQAKEIDLSLYGTWERDYLKTHFVWEAKRIGDKRANEEYSPLTSEYVNEAIYRFIRLDYAAGLNDAGVLGYTLAGEIVHIVADINATMGNIHKNPPLPASNHLQSVRPIHQFEHIYQSHHARTDRTDIKLHHLFLPFDFV